MLKRIEKRIDKCRWSPTQQLQKLVASATEALPVCNVEIGIILSDWCGGKELISIRVHVTPFFQ
jgi:hypothetical protein